MPTVAPRCRQHRGEGFADARRRAGDEDVRAFDLHAVNGYARFAVRPSSSCTGIVTLASGARCSSSLRDPLAADQQRRLHVGRPHRDRDDGIAVEPGDDGVGGPENGRDRLAELGDGAVANGQVDGP